MNITAMPITFTMPTLPAIPSILVVNATHTAARISIVCVALTIWSTTQMAPHATLTIWHTNLTLWTTLTAQANPAAHSNLT